jgi:hypothetical protein
VGEHLRGQRAGPAGPAYLADAPLLEVFTRPLIRNVTLGVGALSYAGQFSLTVVADGQPAPTSRSSPPA